MGIQYIASALREAGFNTTIIIFEGETKEQVLKSIMSHNPCVVGLPLFKETREMFLSIAKDIKENNQNIKIITGGHTATLYAAKVLKMYGDIDIVVCGEGEATLVELCNILKYGGSLEQCKGIFYRKDGQVYRNPERAPIKDLDKLPFPAIDVLDCISEDEDPCLFVTISSSRGCLGNCEFCVEHRVSKGPNFPQWRGRTPENIIDEIKNIKENFPDKRLIVNFVDGAIEDPEPLSKGRLKRLIKLIEDEDINMAFSFLTRAESWSEKDEELIKRMKRVGLYSVSIGLESGSIDTLKIFGKRATIEDNLRTCDLFRKNGIPVYGFLIMFHPYVSLDGLKDTAKFLKKQGMAYRPDVWAHAVYVYPDTKLFRRITQDGLMMGTDESEYIYSYAYKDGQVKRVYDVMVRIKNSSEFQGFQYLLDNICQKLEVYEVWKNYYHDMKKAENLIYPFKSDFQVVLDEMATCQCQLFLSIIESVKNNSLKLTHDEVVSKWRELLWQNQKKLEKKWLRLEMNLGRRGLRIV